MEPHDDDLSVATTEILLPFAIWPEEHDPILPRPSGGSHVLGEAPATTSALVLENTTRSLFSLSSNCQQLPALESSLVSSPEDDSEISNDYSASSSLLEPSSQYLDTAASLLLPMSSLLVSTNFRPADKSSLSKVRPLSSTSNTNSSQFWDKATVQSVVPEESTIYQPNTQPSSSTSPLHALAGRASSNPSTRMMQSDNTIIPAAPLTNGRFDSVHIPRQRRPHRQMASMAGATAYRTNPDSFQIAIELVAPTGTTTVRNVMDVVGNASLLPRWYDAIPDLLITQSSTDRSQSLRQGGGGQPNEVNILMGRRAEHEGEWVEATTTQLIPPDGTNCLVHTSRSLMTMLGFPSYGRVIMFVERQRGQVSLTVGPFPGNVELLHRIHVEQLHPTRVRITDTVKLRQAGNDDYQSPTSSSSDYNHYYFGGPLLGYALEQCLFPSMDNYMDHVLGSMARLRFLVENNDESMYSTYVPPTL